MDIEKRAQNAGEVQDNKIECRACLQIFDYNEDKCLIYIFQPWTPPWDGMGNTIAEDLAKMAKIQVLEADKYSKVICETCCRQLRDACVFTTCVYNNDKLLRQRYPLVNLADLEKQWPKPIQISSINGAVFENPVEIKQEVFSDEESGNNNYMDMDYLDMEIKIEPEEITSQPIQITAVNGSMLHNSNDNVDALITNGYTESYGQNEVKVKEEPMSEEDEESDLTGDLSLTCMLCTKSFNSVSGLKSHVITQHSYKSVKRKTDNSASPPKMNHMHVCSTCRRKFATSTDLLVHETCHNKYTCYGCGDKFESFVALAKHRKKCPKSTGVTVKHKSLDDVMRVKPKIEEETFRCNECNQEFSDEYYYTVHMEIHQPIEAKPVDVNLKPLDGDHKPLEIDKTVDADLKTLLGDLKPVDVSLKPMEVDPKPVKVEPKPVEVDPKTVAEDHNSVETDPKTMDEGLKQVKVELKTVEEDLKTLADEHKQVEGEHKRVEVDLKTLAGEHKPVEIDPKTVDADLKPLANDLKSVEGDLKPVAMETQILEDIFNDT